MHRHHHHQHAPFLFLSHDQRQRQQQQQQVQRVMAEHDGRDVLVMDRTGERLVGLISRTDILQSYRFYSDESFASKEAFCAKDFAADAAEARGKRETGAETPQREQQAGQGQRQGQGQGQAELEPCKVCSAHTDCADFKR
jgi:hypothetical protein